jgi:predicted nucleotidyltransferase
MLPAINSYSAHAQKAHCLEATPQNSGLSEETLAMIRTTLQAFPTVRRALLLGSRAKGDFHAGSDIDMALEGASTLVALDVSAELNEYLPLPYFFDVVALDDVANTPLGEYIERVGTVIF